MSTIPKESQDDLWNEVYRDFQDIFDYRQSSKQRDKWFEDVKKEYFVQRNAQLATDGREELEKENARLAECLVQLNKEKNIRIMELENGLRELIKQYELSAENKFMALGIPYNEEALPTLTKAKQLLNK